MMAAKNSAKVPVLRDWKDPDDYDFTSDLSKEGWAWEFLRRNPDYCEDWKSKLEWYQRDPDAVFEEWRRRTRGASPPSPAGTSPEDKNFRIYSEESVARWLLTHYVNPRNDSLRSVYFDINLVSARAGGNTKLEMLHGLDSFGGDPKYEYPFEGKEHEGLISRPCVPESHAAIVVDLRRPLDSQFSRAAKTLAAELEYLKTMGVRFRNPKPRKQRWRFFLQLLDANSQGVGAFEIANHFDGKDPLRPGKGDRPGKDLDEGLVNQRLRTAKRLTTPEGYTKDILPPPLYLWVTYPSPKRISSS